MVEDKLQSFKRELSSVSEDNASLPESAFKRLKKDSYTFKNNKRQYEHQEKVLESFSQAQACITFKKFEKAAEKIKQGITLVKKNRMKLIRLADKSEFGWRTAIECEQDHLAPDYEDEKRIQKSERAVNALSSRLNPHSTKLYNIDIFIPVDTTLDFSSINKYSQICASHIGRIRICIPLDRYPLLS